LIPVFVRLSELALITGGLEQRNTDLSVGIRGLALVTGLVTNDIWIGPTLIATGWTVCCASVTTTWTDTYTQPSTGWSLVA
jgi:hypothetical protein